MKDNKVNTLIVILALVSIILTWLSIPLTVFSIIWTVVVGTAISPHVFSIMTDTDIRWLDDE